jgi:hypothetical protein
VTAAEWLVCRDPIPMLELVRGKAGERKVRLLAVAFLRHLQHLMPEDRCEQVLEVAERYADGNASLKELKRARQQAEQALIRAAASAENVASAVWHATMRSRPMTVSFELLRDPGNAPHFAALVRDGFGNPFRPSPPLPPAVLAWNDGTVRCMAEGIYDERAFDRLPILADALEEAGCDNPDILTHCRQPGSHVRGCWVVDLLLGKG